jgi:hypothetical protein
MSAAANMALLNIATGMCVCEGLAFQHS